MPWSICRKLRAGGRQPSETKHNLEREAHAEFTPKRARSECRRRVDEALRMSEGSGIGDAQGVVVAIIGPVSQVERLRDQFQLHALAKLERLGHSQIELEEWITAQQIVLVNRALLGDVVADGVPRRRFRKTQENHADCFSAPPPREPFPRQC